MSDLEQSTGQIAQAIRDELDKIGIYTVQNSSHVQSIRGKLDADEDGNAPDIEQMLVDGEATVYIDFITTINQYAWSDRVLDPDGFDTDVAMEADTPREEEVMTKIIDEDVASEWDDW